MTKSKSKSETEYLRGVIRELKSQNRNLKKQLNRKDKREFYLEEREAEVLLEEELDERNELLTNKCPKCSGELELVDLAIKKVWMCNDCNYRKVQK